MTAPAAPSTAPAAPSVIPAALLQPASRFEVYVLLALVTGVKFAPVAVAVVGFMMALFSS